MEVSVKFITSFLNQKDTISVVQFEIPNTSLKPCIIYKGSVGKYVSMISGTLVSSEFRCVCNDSMTYTYIDDQYVERTCLTLFDAIQKLNHVSPICPNDSFIDNISFGIPHRTYGVPDSILESVGFSTDEALISLVISALQNHIMKDVGSKDSLESKIIFLQKCINIGNKYSIVFPQLQLMLAEFSKLVQSEIKPEPKPEPEPEPNISTNVFQPKTKFFWIF